MMRPNIDGKLAQRVRDIAALEVDSQLSGGTLPGVEKTRILEIAADVLEEYILAAKGDTINGRREVVEECARVVDRFIAITEVSPFWDTRTTECLRRIPDDIRKLSLTPSEGGAK